MQEQINTDEVFDTHSSPPQAELRTGAV